MQGKASVQPLYQEGDQPSESMPSVPPPAVPEGNQPQHGGQPRSALHDPMRLVARFHSAGWKKDLEHVLRVYYKYNAASFKEVDWVSLKEMFFAYFLPHKEEALGIKERCPIDYMACIEEHFWRATGLSLHGLRGFTGWIKQGSYYHGVVAQQGHLQKCLHLAGLPLPRWSQVMPSESHQESQMKAEATATSSSNATEQPATHHNKAGRGIMHLHPEMLPCKATCLGNQVTCMIAEYHLTCSAQGSSSLSPILPVEAAALLPSIKNYVPGIAFEGCRDVRVMD